jgi:hypothetical protein
MLALVTLIGTTSVADPKVVIVHQSRWERDDLACDSEAEQRTRGEQTNEHPCCQQYTAAFPG